MNKNNIILLMINLTRTYFLVFQVYIRLDNRCHTLNYYMNYINTPSTNILHNLYYLFVLWTIYNNIES